MPMSTACWHYGQRSILQSGCLKERYQRGPLRSPWTAKLTPIPVCRYYTCSLHLFIDYCSVDTFLGFSRQLLGIVEYDRHKQTRIHLSRVQRSRYGQPECCQKCDRASCQPIVRSRRWSKSCPDYHSPSVTFGIDLSMDASLRPSTP